MYRPRIIAALALTIAFAACSSPPGPSPAPSTSPADPASVYDPKAPQTPAPPLNGERVAEGALPAELAAWKQAEPSVPGGISRAIGESLYVFASPGVVGNDAQLFWIGDARVLEDRVEVEAYLEHARADVNQGRFYPKDYVMLDYTGSAEELPVKLKIHYDSAAYAHADGPFEAVDPAYLPAFLQDWLAPSGAPEGKAARFGGYLYIMAAAGPQLQEGQYFQLANVVLLGDRVEVTANAAPLESAPPEYPASAVLIARIPFQSDQVPAVDLKIRDVVPTDLSQVDRVVVLHLQTRNQKEFTGQAAAELAGAIADGRLVPMTWATPQLEPDLRIQFFSGEVLVAEADADMEGTGSVIIAGENAVRSLTGAPMELLQAIGENLN